MAAEVCTCLSDIIARLECPAILESERVQYNSKDDGTLIVNHVGNPPGDMAVFEMHE